MRSMVEGTWALSVRSQSTPPLHRAKARSPLPAIAGREVDGASRERDTNFFLSPLRGERSDCQRVPPEVAGPMTTSAIRVRGPSRESEASGYAPLIPTFSPRAGRRST
jgi:hypothetical protein